MLPAIAIIALMAALTGQPNTFAVPSETLAPTIGGGIYVGDDLECTPAREATWRYTSDKTLSLCSNGVWQEITITPETR